MWSHFSPSNGGSMKCNPSEMRQINGGPSGTASQPLSVSTANGQVRVFQSPGGACEILEISMQPIANAHLQLFEGGSAQGGGIAMSAVRYVQQYLLWSEPGKIVSSDI